MDIEDTERMQEEAEYQRGIQDEFPHPANAAAAGYPFAESQRTPPSDFEQIFTTLIRASDSIRKIRAVAGNAAAHLREYASQLGKGEAVLITVDGQAYAVVFRKDKRDGVDFFQLRTPKEAGLSQMEQGK